MSTVTETQRDLIEATGRFTIYSLLANGFAFPTWERLEVISSRLLPAAAMLQLPDHLGVAVRSVTSNLTLDLDRAREHYTALFPPIASQDAPGYETGYRGDGIFQQAELMADVAGFYRAHGLRAGGSDRERPDHMTVELEFMAFVAKKEALALQRNMSEEVLVCHDSAALFLRDHLGCWAPAFGRRAAAISSSPWLAGLGELTAVWVEHDMTGYGVQPAEVVEGPLPQEPPDDGACGPCPSSTGMTP